MVGVGTSGQVAWLGAHAKIRVEFVKTGANGDRRELEDLGASLYVWQSSIGRVWVVGGAV